ncbi:ATP-dependent DNA helicase [Flavihumibacter profundi]|uniref:ATP-dependent DNA helicase n=1 Tax=Flavihumibacter profundi TaxID=2716883 RepID=UPI001CC4E4C1|nr:AAA family ATPase [Flavihumibacter profundi]MBZ5857557.1 AAA family ATPase [Flavihumibacter profundi]
MPESLVAFVNSKYNPTSDQLEALRQLESFFAGSEKCFLLKGYAGTGKTFITKCLSDYFKEQKRQVLLMAPTGRAARILQERTGLESTTIHRAIYNLNEVDEVEFESPKPGKANKKKYKFRYSLKHIESNTANIYLVDEASMVSDNFTEDDFFIFGSGHLLTDMMSLIALNNQGRVDKLVFIGDNAQLPPVGSNISPALSAEYFNEKFKIEVSEYELTHVVRQGAESGILANAFSIRELINNKQRLPYKVLTNFKDVTLLSNEKVVDTYIQKNPAIDVTSAVIINHSNKSALDYNTMIRDKLFPGKTNVMVDDILIIHQNNYNYDVEILNGMFVKVKQVNAVTEVKSGMMSYDADGKECEVSHVFRRIIIDVPDKEGYKEVGCMILDNFLSSPNPSLDYSENIALYLDFKLRHPQLKPKSKEFSDALRKDPYFNAIRVKYGYAVTCHKAQGGEWKNVIVNLDLNMGKSSIDFLRWVYTAITRATDHLFVFNVGDLGQFGKMTYVRKHLEESQKRQITFYLPSNYDQLLIQFGLVNASSFQVVKFKEILARLSRTDIEVVDRKPFNYQEVYFFKRNETLASVSFWYNGKEKFTRFGKQISPGGNDGLYLELESLFNEPVDIHITDESINFPTENEGDVNDFENSFPPESTQLKNLYQEMKELLSALNISIIAVNHFPYQEKYTFKRGLEKAMIQFYYNSGFCFTKAEPNLQHCNSNDLLDTIESVLTDLKSIS